MGVDLGMFYIAALLVDTARTTDPIVAPEALVYCVGALKFLSGNTTILKQLVRNNCIEAAGKLLAAINKQVCFSLVKNIILF